MSKGKIIQVMGPVVDVAFEDEHLPHIKDALAVDNQGKRCVMEVAQHIGCLLYTSFSAKTIDKRVFGCYIIYIQKNTRSGVRMKEPP